MEEVACRLRPVEEKEAATHRSREECSMRRPSSRREASDLEEWFSKHSLGNPGGLPGLELLT